MTQVEICPSSAPCTLKFIFKKLAQRQKWLFSFDESFTTYNIFWMSHLANKNYHYFY